MKKIRIILFNIYTLILPFIGGILGAIGGAGNKGARRILIPGLLTSYAYSNTESLLVITIMLMAAPISMGYGIPDDGYPDDPTADSGSTLGRFYFNLFKRNNRLTDYFTRGTIGLLIALTLISIPIIKHNWLIYGLGSLGIILTEAIISWRGIGLFKLFRRELSWVEFTVWGLITLFSIIIIYF